MEFNVRKKGQGVEKPVNKPGLPPLTASRASMMLVAWLVDPDASAVLKFFVDFPKGRLSMKGVMSTPFTHRPSSARTCGKEAK